MTTSVRRVHYSYAEYLALEDDAATRHEYLDGEIYAMAGGSPDHAALAAAVIGALSRTLPPACRAFTSDLRVRIVATGLSTYPDAAVVCGPSLRASDDPLAVVNPVLLVEVTSPSTEEYDRGEKLRHYQAIPSLREVVVVSHRSRELTVHRRDGDRWVARTYGAGDTVELLGGGMRVPVDEVYRGGLEDVGLG
jgi:Uma2 family endonuclease